MYNLRNNYIDQHACLCIVVRLVKKYIWNRALSSHKILHIFFLEIDSTAVLLALIRSIVLQINRNFYATSLDKCSNSFF